MPAGEIGINSLPYIEHYLLEMERGISKSNAQLAVRTFRKIASDDDKLNFLRILQDGREPISRGAQGQAFGTVIAQAAAAAIVAAVIKAPPAAAAVGVGVVAFGPAGDIGGKIGSYIQDHPPMDPPRF